ncbi:unnamed protein product [Prorocentrum cordatum]|uniref:Subtilisin n=1 Tax=Prorocentrum cordatum TaxID=2364126 RepID=A0ABN9X8E8_9DINO|nr:unnamed protein product [Polarella glacialis]
MMIATVTRALLAAAAGEVAAGLHTHDDQGGVPHLNKHAGRVFVGMSGLIGYTGQYSYEVMHGTACGAAGIYAWSSGQSSNYGQGYNVDVDGCMTVCSSFLECAGFVLQESDCRCSFWKADYFSPYALNFQCHVKQVLPDCLRQNGLLLLCVRQRKIQRWPVGRQGCPSGASPIYDSTTCAQAASLFGL